jgi:hypothetical protein
VPGAFGSELQSAVSLHEANLAFAFYNETKLQGGLGSTIFEDAPSNNPEKLATPSSFSFDTRSRQCG